MVVKGKTSKSTVIAAALALCLAITMMPISAFAGEGTVEFKSWKTLYSELGAETPTDAAYDAVTTATKIAPNVHYRHIPSVVEKNVIEQDEEGKATNVSLTGVNITGSSEKEVTLSSETHHATFEGKAQNKTYGSDEFNIMLDYTGKDYTWDDYLDKVYAVTVSNGSKTIGALPWVDWYGEKATQGPHYNKVEVALNSGSVVARENEVINRFDAFYENGELKTGNYTVTVYADGFKPLVAEDIWVPKRAGAELLFGEATSTSVPLTFTKELPADFQPVYTVDGKTATYKDGVLSFEAIKPGTHNVVISSGNMVGENKKYGDVQTSFTYSVSTVPVKYNGEKLVATEGDIADYTAAITAVSVNGQNYNATGRGAVRVINSDGTFDLSKTIAAESSGPIEFVITALGYPEVSFTTNDIGLATIKAIKAQKYNGKSIMPGTTIMYAGKELAKDVDYKVAYKNNKNAGTASITVTGTGNYTGSQTATFKINKAANKMMVKTATKKVKAKKLKRKKQLVSKAIIVNQAIGKVAYKKVGGNKNLSVNAKSGKITLKKKTKKGLYKIKVKVTATGNTNYNAAAKVVTVKVKVK